MTQTQPVLWTKGILLDPQHLQAQDRYLEGLLQARIGAATFRPWGFRRLALDADALATGTVALTDAAGLLPDGLPFDIPAADAAPAPRAVLPHWEADAATLDVFLGIPEYRAGARNIALLGGTAAAREAGGSRYRAEVLLVRDETSGQAERPIQVAAKNLRVLLGTETLEGYSTLQIARLTRDVNDVVRLDEDFIPPLLDIAASPALVRIARRLVEILAAKSSSLAGARRQKNQSLADFSITDVGSFWLLYNVNQAFPVIRHLAEHRGGHPVALYEAMLSLASTLTTFSDRITPRQLPPYVHDDLTATFTVLDEQVRRLLETVVPSYCVSLPLVPTQPTISAVALDDDRYLAGRQHFLAVRSALPRHELSVRVPGSVKVSSADRVETLIRQALPGLTLTHTPSPPSEVPMKLDAEYFAIDRGAEWDAVRRARNLAAYVPADIPGVEMELVILLPKS
jgi:type VI secretion system protein ImpJ